MIEFFSNHICKYVPWPSLTLLLTLSSFFLVVGIVSWSANKATKFILEGVTRNLIGAVNSAWGNVFIKHKAIHKLSHVVPALVFYTFSNALQTNDLDSVVQVGKVVEVLCLVYMSIAIALSLSSLINVTQEIYNLYPISNRLPVKTYTQVLKILLVSFTAIVVTSIILDTSPIAFFTGLGAATAIIMLVFKDSILGFVASIQLSLYDIVRIGDWITAPTYGVDGDVLEVSLSTVKVRNFDKTISTIPTSALLSTALQNWRGMKEAGGRRIKRSIRIDIDFIRFCSPKELDKIKNDIPAVAKFIDEKLKEHKNETAISAISNSSIYREYINILLRNNKGLHQQGQGFTFLVRQLEATEKGLPIQLYVFTNDTNWVTYEHIQADIFDHLFAAAPLFGLKIFQDLSDKTKALELS